jgi:hypothetical protein
MSGILGQPLDFVGMEMGVLMVFEQSFRAVWTSPGAGIRLVIIEAKSAIPPLKHFFAYFCHSLKSGASFQLGQNLRNPAASSDDLLTSALK